ncbi:hypothetical protein [Epidermidibacterium keratini]|uniref:hypothetical protein n=1 Tax=Epidermidibacterium keratini TaxID=1891644 RepID=UPI0018658C46|nr:hypothetical protein [Epidermidibacterium keratini]
MTGWDAIRAAIEMTLRGEREQGGRAMAACWDVTGEADDAQRCVLAHYLADVQGDLDAEVEWDERALASYVRVGDGDLAEIGIPSARGLAPSLHLNLGDGYLRQGRLAEARVQLEAGQLAQHLLGSGGYAELVREGLDRLAAKIEAAGAAMATPATPVPSAAAPLGGTMT